MSERHGELDAKSQRTDHWVIDLPAEVRGNQARLRNTAANLLRLAHVRSVIIDERQLRAVVRLHRGSERRPEAAADLPFDDMVESSDSDSVISWIDLRDDSLCFIRLPARTHGWRRAFFILAAAGALVLGVLGVILPGLPTTPFVLVASYCLLRSSPRLHARLLQSRLFGDVLRDWHLHRGIGQHIRYKATAGIVLVLGGSLYFTSVPFVVKLLILSIGVCGIAYVWRLPDATRVSSAESS